MFFNSNLEKTTQNIKENITLAQVGLKQFSADLLKAIDPRVVMNDASAINEATANMTRTVLGQGREITNQIQTTIANAQVETLKFGATAQDNLELFSSINNQLQNSKFLTEDQVISMQRLKHIAGLTSDEMGKFVVGFDTIGFGIQDTINKVSELQKDARSYGLNVGQFMRSVGDNIKLLASYNFKGGVDGLSKMVAQAQSLRIDMSKTVSFAEGLMSPEKAIETAAGFQMLGGAVGDLGDPFKLLHMAQTDMAGLQDSLVDMAAGAVSFNEETGEFDIPVTQMYRLREAAKLAGYSYQEFSELALNSAKKTQKLDMLSGMNEIPEENKELLANLSQFDGGELKVKLPGQDDMVRVQDLTNEQISELEKFQKENQKSDKTLAIEANGYLKQIAGAQSSLKSIPAAEALKSGEFVDAVNEMVKNFSKISNRAQKFLRDDIKPSRGFDAVSKIEIPPLSDEQINKIFENMGNGFNKILTGVEDKLKDFDINELMKDTLSTLDEMDIFNPKTPQREIPTGSGSVKVESPAQRELPNPLPPAQREMPDSVVNSNVTGNNGNFNSGQISMVVTGDINLKLNDIPTNSVLTQEEFNNLLIRNPEAMSIIKSKLLDESQWT